MIEYFENFEKLCNHLYFQYTQDKDKFEKLRHSIVSIKYFNRIIPFDKTKQEDIADILNLLYKRIIEQPYWYLDAFELFPGQDKLNERANFLFRKIEHRQDKFDEFIFSVKVQFNDFERKDKEGAARFYNEILIVVEDILMYIYSNSFGQISFDYKKSPLFIQLMEFILLVKRRTGNPYYEKIDNYLNNIAIYKVPFKIKESLIYQTSLPDIKPNSNSLTFNPIKNPIIIDALIVWDKNKFLKKNRNLLFIIDYLYNQKHVSDEMITDFLLNFPLILRSIRMNDEKLGKQIDLFIEPVFDKIQQFLNTVYLRYNVEKNIDTGEGLEIIDINGWVIPIVPDKIIRYIKETNSPFITSKNIIEAKLGFFQQQNQQAFQLSNLGLENLTKQEMKVKVENGNRVLDKIEYIINNYSNLGIGTFNKEVQPFENIKNSYDDLVKSLIGEVDNNRLTYERAISYLEILKLQFSSPKNTHNNTKDYSQLHVDFLQNKIATLSALSVFVVNKQLDPPEQPKKVPEKWYAILHLILIELGVEEKFIDKTDKKAIISFGKNRYKLTGKGQTFYKWIYSTNVSNMTTVVNSLLDKEKPHWKKTITEISNNDHKVIIWLKNQPK